MAAGHLPAALVFLHFLLDDGDHALAQFHERPGLILGKRMSRSTHPNNRLRSGIHTTQEVIDRDIQYLSDVAKSLQAGISGTIFNMPEGLNRKADFLCQVIAGDILFLSSSSDPLTHKNDVDFHIVHLYALSTVWLVYRIFTLK